MPELTIESLAKSFGDTMVLDDVSFGVGEGEFCVLLGPSGCGKTTLLRIIAGLEQQDAGDVLVDGESLTGRTPRQRDVAMVFQTYALYPHMTAFDNMAFPLRARKLPDDDIRRRVEEAAELLGLAELLERKPRELSGGQRQRVAIGRAIVRDPRLFLFDEPLSNLDAGLRTGMRVEIARLHRELAATMIYVTHDQVEAMTLADKIVLLHEGEIQQIGAPRALYDRPANRFVAGFIGGRAMNLIDGRLESGDGGPVFRAGELAIPVDRLDLDLDLPADATLGVRPEAMTPLSGREDSGRGEHRLTAEVELVEHIGAETVVHARRGDHRLRACADADWEAAAGDTVDLTWPKDRTYLFGGDGRRLYPRPETQ